MDHGDSLKGNLFFAAGRAAASRGWFDAVLVTGSDVLNVAPVGPPVVVVVQGGGLELEEAKALASASGAGTPHSHRPRGFATDSGRGTALDRHAD